MKTYAKMYIMGYRHVRLCITFLPICWFLKTDRYFFFNSISSDVSKKKRQKYSGMQEKTPKIFCFYTIRGYFPTVHIYPYLVCVLQYQQKGTSTGTMVGTVHHDKKPVKKST